MKQSKDFRNQLIDKMEDVSCTTENRSRKNSSREFILLLSLPIFLPVKMLFSSLVSIYSSVCFDPALDYRCFHPFHGFICASFFYSIQFSSSISAVSISSSVSLMKAMSMSWSQYVLELFPWQVHPHCFRDFILHQFSLSPVLQLLLLSLLLVFSLCLYDEADQVCAATIESFFHVLWECPCM